MSDTWLFVGGNKDLPTQYVQALRFAQRFTTITTNRGIVWLRVPDYHFVTNQGGILPLWHELALEALKRGTHVVTPSGRKAIGYADTFIDASEGFPRRGGYGDSEGQESNHADRPEERGARRSSEGVRLRLGGVGIRDSAL